MKRHTHIIGVDEAGRGPLAGPVAVGTVLIPARFDWGLIPGVGDSKKIAPKDREAVFRRAQVLKKTGALDFAVSLVGNTTIDRAGITHAVKLGIERALRRLRKHDSSMTKVLLDGLLAAPERYVYQKTIIGGDGKERAIGLASIIAKVTRDKFMVRQSTKYSLYGFEIHKGYGTKAHRDALKRHGLSQLHRKSFCKRFQ